jgi:hypothetical protein
LNGLARVPVVGASVADQLMHYQLWQSPGNGDGLNDACVASDGSIVRVRLTRGSNTVGQSFQYQRVTDPTNAGQWSAFTTFGGGNGTVFQDGGCAVSNNNGVLRAFCQQGASTGAVWVWTSNDNGQTWSSSPGVALTPPAPYNGTFTLGMASAGNNDVFCILLGPSQTATFACAFYSGGSWGAPRVSTLTNLFTYGNGLAAAWDGANYWLIASDNISLYLCSYTPTITAWAAYPNILQATSASVTRCQPRLKFDAVSGLYHLVYIEADLNATTGPTYYYPRLRQSIDLQHWSQGSILHGITTQYGAGIVCSTSSNYVVSLPTIYRSSNYSTSDPTRNLDVSGAVLSYTRHEQRRRPATLVVLLDNNGAVISQKISKPGTQQPIGPNCSLVLSEGYKTGSPPTTKESVTVATYRIQSIIIQRNPHENRVQLHCADLTANFDLLNRYQVTYSNQTVAFLLRDVCTLAGIFQIALPTTAQMNNTIATFVVQPGKPFRAAINELCDIYALEYFLDQSETLQFRELSSSDPSVWSYLPEIEQLTLSTQTQQGNHIIVTGRPPGSAGGSNGIPLVTAEAYDDGNIAFVGQERVVNHVDLKLTSTAQCAMKAAFLLAQYQREQSHHQITVPLNPALQMLDVLTLNDTSIPSGSGQSSTGRIIESTATFTPEKAEFGQRLVLDFSIL